MKHPTLFEGVGLALLFSLGGSILFSALSQLLSAAVTLRLLIAVAGFGYSLYLLTRSPAHVGQITAFISWILMAGVSWFLAASLPMYLAMHLAAIWLIRSLYFYSSLFSALIDLLLTGLGLSSAIWAFLHTGSLFIAIWCFFLSQALFVFIPKTMRSNVGAVQPEREADERFERAHNAAQAALRKLSSTL